MSARCICARAEALLLASPWWNTLDWGARYLLATLAKRLLEPGWGGRIPFSDTRRVSLLVSDPKSETETHLETLLGLGLLARDDGGGLVCPLVAPLLDRVARAAENGRRGGRPRKGETAAEAYQRRQMALLLPVSGGAARETHETEPVETGAATTTTTKTTSTTPTEAWSGPVGVASAPPARVGGEGPPGWIEVAKRCVAAAGMGERSVFAEVRTWMGEGIPADVIEAAVEAAAARPSFDGRQIKTLRYFDRPVREAWERARRGEALPVAHREAASAASEGGSAQGWRGVAPLPEGPGDSPYQLAYQAWVARGCLGEPPFHPALAARRAVA